jgi:putative permease
MDNDMGVGEEAERQLALISEEQLSRMLDNLGAELVNYGATLVSFSGVLGVVSLLIFLVLMPVLVFFFLKDKRQPARVAGALHAARPRSGHQCLARS